MQGGTERGTAKSDVVGLHSSALRGVNVDSTMLVIGIYSTHSFMTKEFVDKGSRRA